MGNNVCFLGFIIKTDYYIIITGARKGSEVVQVGKMFLVVICIKNRNQNDSSQGYHYRTKLLLIMS